MSKREKQEPRSINNETAVLASSESTGADRDEPEAQDEEDVEETEEAPRVLLTTLKELGQWAPSQALKGYANRPIWFVLEMDGDLIGLFERIPEDPMPKGLTDTILAALRQFALDHSDELQRLLGVSDGIAYGFHADASLSDVSESFEDDGFEIVGSLRSGIIGQ